MPTLLRDLQESVDKRKGNRLAVGGHRIDISMGRQKEFFRQTGVPASRGQDRLPFQAMFFRNESDQQVLVNQTILSGHHRSDVQRP